MARLLLVDDDIAEISAVKRALARAALAPVLATNASDALASIAQRRPDLLLIGATCENGGALALARRLEQDPATRGLPLIVLGTAEDLPPGAVQLPRPVDPAALSEQVKALLGEPRPVPPPPPPARPAPRKAAVTLGRLATPALDLEPKAPPAPPVPSAPPAAAGATEAPPPPAGPAAARPAFERRGPPIALPQPLERRAQPSDPANARRAAADALRARAEELRRAPEPPASPAAAEAAAGLDALFELAPPAGVSLDQLALTPAPASLPAYAPKTTLPGYGPAPAPAFDPFAEPELEPARPAEPAPPAAPEEAPAPAAEAPPPFDGSAFQSEDGAFIAETPFDLPPESTVELEEVAVPPPPAGAEADTEAPRPAPAPEPWPPPPVARPRSLLEEAEERAAAEASLRAEAEATRAREAEQRAQAEAEARAAAALAAEAAAVRAREAEELARTEAGARAEAARRAEEAAGRARVAEAAAREEAEARRLLEQELARLRQQLEVDRRSHETELRSAVERTAAEHAAEATRRGREREEAQAAELRSAAEAARRAAQAAAEAEVARRAELEARAVAEAEAAGRRAEAEARARADAEAAHQAALAARQAAEAQAESEAARRAELEAALARATEEAGRLAAERDALVKAAAEPPPLPRLADVPPPDEAQESARRRALSLRSRREPEPAGAAWPSAPEPAPREPEPEPEPEPVEPPPATPPAELRSGSLEELPAPRLLALAARARLTGRLDVTGDVERSLWFDDGRVVGAASSASGERVEEVALRLGLLTREQHRQVAGPAAALPARRAALLLVDRGYVKPAELTALVRRRTDEVVFGVFAESGARFVWAPERVPADERIAPDRPTLALAVEGVRRRWLAPRAEAVLGGPASLLTPIQGGPTPADLGLGAEERRALALADGLRTLDEVLALSPLDPLSTRQVLAAAILAGALTVRVVQAGRPTAQVSAAIDLARVKEKLEQVRRADYFTILGLGRVCTPHEVREAAERLLAEFDPRRHAGGGEAGLPARLAEIRQVVADARDVLADDALRAEYVRGLGE